MFFISFPTFSYPFRPQATTSIGYTKPYVNPIKSNLLITYTYHNTLWVKHSTHQKVKSLRAASMSTTSVIFHLFSFCVQPSKQSTPKIFFLPQPFRKFRLHQETREIGKLVRTDTDTVTLMQWTVIT